MDTIPPPDPAQRRAHEELTVLKEIAAGNRRALFCAPDAVLRLIDHGLIVKQYGHYYASTSRIRSAVARLSVREMG